MTSLYILPGADTNKETGAVYACVDNFAQLIILLAVQGVIADRRDAHVVDYDIKAATLDASFDLPTPKHKECVIVVHSFGANYYRTLLSKLEAKGVKVRSTFVYGAYLAKDCIESGAVKEGDKEYEDYSFKLLKDQDIPEDVPLYAGDKEGYEFIRENKRVKLVEGMRHGAVAHFSFKPREDDPKDFAVEFAQLIASVLK